MSHHGLSTLEVPLWNTSTGGGREWGRQTERDPQPGVTEDPQSRKPREGYRGNQETAGGTTRQTPCHGESRARFPRAAQAFPGNKGRVGAPWAPQGLSSHPGPGKGWTEASHPPSFPQAIHGHLQQDRRGRSEAKWTPPPEGFLSVMLGSQSLEGCEPRCLGRSMVPPSLGRHRPQLCCWGHSNCPQDHRQPKSLGLFPSHPMPPLNNPEGRVSSSWGMGCSGDILSRIGGLKESQKGSQPHLNRDYSEELCGEGDSSYWGSDTPPRDTQLCRHLARHRRGSRRGREHPAAFAAGSWLTSPFRVVGLVPTFPPPPPSSTLQRAGCRSCDSACQGRTHAVTGNTAAARSSLASSLVWGHPQPQPALFTWFGSHRVGAASSPHSDGQIPARCQALPHSHSPLAEKGETFRSSGLVRAPGAATWPERVLESIWWVHLTLTAEPRESQEPTWSHAGSASSLRVVSPYWCPYPPLSLSQLFYLCALDLLGVILPPPPTWQTEYISGRSLQARKP